jgi:serine/threonine-protein kinase
VLADSQYESEASSYLQGRLRLFFGVILVLATSLFVMSEVISLMSAAAYRMHLGQAIHFGAILVACACFLMLRRRRYAARTLLVFDAVGLYLSIGTCLAIYAIHYERGMVSIPAILVLFVVGRAVVVPCNGRTTLLLSLVAPLGVLGVELAYGTYYVKPGVRVDADFFFPTVIWNQVVLLAGCGIAAFTSRVNYGLRLQVRKARQLGQYRLEESIGRGSMGEVYRATHALLRRPTAVKLLHPEITGEETLARFEREVRETSRLTHPNTIRIYDYGHTPDGVFYYAMELLDGFDLRVIVEKTGPFPPARTIHILAQACAALREAHGIGLVHRDVKAGNLMICRRAGEHDVVKVVDFGLVKDLRDTDSGLTQMGTICGTPETLAPEVITGSGNTPSADIYALGCVGYYLLTGHQAFDAKSALDFLNRHMNEPPIPLRKRDPSIPEDLEAVILRCLEKNPRERFPSAAALRGALLRCHDARLWTQKRAADWWAEFEGSDAQP